MIQIYPEQKDNLPGYAEAISQLYMATPTETNYRIVVSKHRDQYGEHFDVSGKNGMLNRDTVDYPLEIDQAQWGDQEATQGIEFVDWSEWLGMEIDPETQKNFTDLDIVCHCLWEMTFFGFKYPDIHGKLERFQQQVDAIKNEKEKTQGSERTEG